MNFIKIISENPTLFQDCRDGSDEVACEVTCGADQFQCTEIEGHRCLPTSYRCDREEDCKQGEDEEGCDYTCPDTEFICVTGTISRFPFVGYCIYEHERCNGVTECKDGSDEHNCMLTECVQGEFLCVNGNDVQDGDKCIPSEYVCDKVNDCTSGEDEKNCDYVCPDNHFACVKGPVAITPHRGYCLPQQLHCDTQVQCQDGSDETICLSTTCPPNYFHCTNGTDLIFGGTNCVSNLYICDREKDCSDNSDEEGCTYICPEGQTACMAGKISRYPFTGYCIYDREVSTLKSPSKNSYLQVYIDISHSTTKYIEHVRPWLFDL